MTEAEQRQAATNFSNYWRNKGDEESDSQRFWIDFIQDVLGVEDATKKIIFEKRVNVDGNTKKIDVYIPETRTLIEQKSITKDLHKEYPQSGGWMATPFQQARRYSQFLPVDEAARFIIACNFKTFEIHDMNKPQDAPVVIELDEIRDKLPLFDFMFTKEVKEISHEMEVSVKAGEIVGILYEKLLDQYKDPDEESLKSLNALCVRLVFCLYAEDAGIFGSRTHTIFHDYLQDVPAVGMRKALKELFEILDTKEENRDKYLAEDNPALAAFPYVNGGLFADENIEIPPFTDELKTLLLEKASADFDWSDISPTIFGAVFESTLNPETRRSGGMHYTSIENIHKVIDPLFLDDLKAEFEEIKAIDVKKTKETKLKQFQDKLASLKFLDPACGSGNFLTETYVSIRRLENKVLFELSGGQITLADENYTPIKVNISQFYGIEINDFAVTVAKTALWIAESQMMKETEDVIHMSLNFLPLKTNASIVEGNSLQIDWETVVSKNELSYIMGNPPFVGYAYRNEVQKEDMKLTGVKDGNLDYVAAWYVKSAAYIKNTNIKVAFVSTNSITQGAQATGLWKQMVEEMRCEILFAHLSFRWDSEANQKAQVHCVIVGFAEHSEKEKIIYTNNNKTIVSNINGYLVDGPDVYIEKRMKPICDVPEIYMGSSALDDGNLVLDEGEYNDLTKEYPILKKYIRPYMMGKDFIERKPRYCFWFKGIEPNEIKGLQAVKDRLKKVQEFRSKSNRRQTLEAANTPYLFGEIRNCEDDYIAIPKVSSERRRYIPMDYLDRNIIAGDKIFQMPHATKYAFGILMSNVHMAWMRAVCGRLKSDYSYSNTIVYNNFIWPTPTEAQKLKIEQTAQAILDARALYPDSSLADLYDPLTMPVELLKAHQQNDRAVMQAYGFDIKNTTEEDCVAALMKMYQELTKAE